jgi:mannose-1-phosphate guanylyltransferase
MTGKTKREIDINQYGIMEVYALIIAGGVGARFWPRSRERSPKQLLDIVGPGTMLQNTIARLNPLVPAERILIVTNSMQADEMRRQTPAIPHANILIEPVGRNTAPAIAFGAEILKRRAGEVVMVVLPADHLVQDVAAFQEVLQRAIRVAEESRGLVTVGITPTRPETGYGYIQFDDGDPANPWADAGAWPVKTFAEKPNVVTARRFLESGDFLWNSGMFVFRVSSILNGVAEHLPDMSEEFHRLRPSIDTPGFEQALDSMYRQLHSISIDYGIMEKAANRYILPAQFGWNDLGSWDEVYNVSPHDDRRNSIAGNVIARDAAGCLISATRNRPVAVIGIEDAIVISTDDAVLVCKRGRSQEVKDIVDQLRKNNMTGYL